MKFHAHSTRPRRIILLRVIRNSFVRTVFRKGERKHTFMRELGSPTETKRKKKIVYLCMYVYVSSAGFREINGK